MSKHIAVATLKSITPYGQNRFYQVPKLEKELAQDFEERTWRERCHYNQDGYIFIPPMAFKNGLSDTAKYLSEPIGQGKGKATYTKHFDAGILVVDGPVLPEKKETVPGHWQLVPSDGGKNGAHGPKVLKCFPMIQQWEANVTFYILDPIITKDVFEKHMREFGALIGIGWFRPRNKGYWGRFSLEELAWKDA